MVAVDSGYVHWVALTQRKPSACMQISGTTAASLHRGPLAVPCYLQAVPFFWPISLGQTAAPPVRSICIWLKVPASSLHT